MVTTKEIIGIAEEAHEGQLYGDLPYVIHPLHLSNVLHPFGERAQHVALLHDVIEDSEFSAVDLRARGVEGDIVSAVESLTRGEEDYQDYIAHLVESQASGSGLLAPEELISAGFSGNELVSLAVLVKLADNLHNTQWRRLGGPAPEQKERLAARYDRAYEALSGSLPDEIVDFVKRRVDGSF